MGLESVELVMQLEEKLGIDIPDDDVFKFRTVGDIANYINSKVYDDEFNGKEKAFKLVKSILMDSFNIPEDEIKEDADLFDDIGLD